MSEAPKFRFLTTAEFNRLSRREKVAYLELAAEQLKDRPGATGSIFSDIPAPPRPVRGSLRREE